jgi:imidazoleglycerol-phosphate dehydratase
MAGAGKLTLHVMQHAGRNTHHIIEAVFKSCARSLRVAVESDPRSPGIPSTKGVL